MRREKIKITKKVLNGYKLTQEQVIEQLQEIHGDSYSFELVNYVNDSTKITVICPEHGQFQKTPMSLKQGSKCNECTKVAKFKKFLDGRTQEEVIKEWENCYPNYIFDDVKLVGLSKKITIKCKEHGYFYPLLGHFIKGSGCRNCKIDARRTPVEEILKECNRIHSNKYTYNMEDYRSKSSIIEIFCPVHGVFKQPVSSHLSGYGCVKCAHDSLYLSTEEVIEELKKLNSKDDFSLIDYTGAKKRVKVICPVHGEYFKTPMALKQGQFCPKCKLNQPEKIILNLFEDHNIKYHYNDRKLIKPLEIDFLIPEHKLAIEHNGLAYHSYGNHQWKALDTYSKLDKNRHLAKTNLVEEQGYQLFHIREDHLKNLKKQDIWKSIILNKCQVSYKIHARKLQVIDLSSHNEFIKQFLEDNHLQGYSVSKIKLGLQDPKTGVVYSIMTFGASRFNKNIQWELLRFCNLKYHIVRGAASKLLKAFERWQLPESLISYANRDWSQGNLYRNLGFDFSHVSEPNYIYTNLKKEIIPRHQVQKHKLKAFLEARNLAFDPEQSERDNMINNGYRIFYDTGNLVFHKFYKQNQINQINHIKE